MAPLQVPHTVLQRVLSATLNSVFKQREVGGQHLDLWSLPLVMWKYALSHTAFLRLEQMLSGMQYLPSQEVPGGQPVPPAASRELKSQKRQDKSGVPRQVPVVVLQS